MAKPDLLPVPLIDELYFQGYETMLPTAFNESLSLLEKVNKILHAVNESGKLTNEMIKKWNEVITWVLNDGLEEAVKAKLEEWLADGTLEDIIGQVLDDLLALKADLAYVNKRFDQIGRDVKEFGAKGDGVTNDTQAFIDAMGNGGYKVFAPKGTYIVDSIRVPSNTTLYGVGDATVFKLPNNASVTRNLLSNKDWGSGNTSITLHDFKLDWNQSRPNGLDPITTGDVDGCGLVLVNTKFAWIDRVSSVGAGRHTFDISAGRYHHEGDSPTAYEPDGCEFIYLNNCYATKSGDDLFTTHFAKHTYITDCIGEYPSGHLFTGTAWNGNCFEVDDGSRFVTVKGCFARGGARGFESKAHEHSPAPNHITFQNCTSDGSIRAFDIRHNNFHRAGDPFSATAKNVSIIGCTAINPTFNPRYPTLDARALVISSYKNVNVTDFRCVGTQSTIEDFPIAVQQLSRYVQLSQIIVNDFVAQYGININGGDAKTDHVSMTNIIVDANVEQGIHIGDDVFEVTMNNIQLIGRNRPNSVGIASVQSDLGLQNLDITGFTNPVKMGTVTYTTTPTRFQSGGFVAGTTTGSAEADASAVLASTGGTKASGDMSVALASSTGEATGTRSAVIATGVSSKASGEYSAVIASRAGIAPESRSVVLSSFGTTALNPNTVVGGHSGGSDTPSTANRKWQLNSENGNITIAGSLASGANFSDYAEMFESTDGQKIETGFIVALDGDKVRKATDGDDLIGVISETAGVILGADELQWSGRFETNSFGGLIYENKEIMEVDEITGEETKQLAYLPKESASYDPSVAYVPRIERDEWQVVGMIGQVFVRVEKGLSQGDTIIAKDGIGVKGDSNWQVMKITTPYHVKRGYAIAKVLIK